MAACGGGMVGCWSTFQLLFLSLKMTNSQISWSGGDVCVCVRVCVEGRGGGLLTYFPTFVPKFKNDKIPNSLGTGGGGGGEEVIDLLSNFCSWVQNDKVPRWHVSWSQYRWEKKYYVYTVWSMSADLIFICSLLLRKISTARWYL